MEAEAGTAHDARGRQARTYRSPLRAERAAETRHRITTAALELFTEHGFGGSTVTAIAKRAGVAPQTVYAVFGTKGAILQALLSRLEEDAGAAEWRARIAAAGDPAIIALRDEADGHRRQALASLIDGLADSGALAAGLARRRAVDRAWMLTGVEIYLAATDGCGWPDAEYATWLTGLLVGQLLASGHAP